MRELVQRGQWIRKDFLQKRHLMQEPMSRSYLGRRKAGGRVGTGDQKKPNINLKEVMSTEGS